MHSTHEVHHHGKYVMDGSEWKAALRLQIEALARRNELHRRCHRDSVLTRTVIRDVGVSIGNSANDDPNRHLCFE
ncbi:hypothetical protein NECAME_04516 [Necator americanus]|uniref:Uncharacterized protein n=1 Tax=Necator americanus TaxID=51031 RepID=W2SU37_NECAM|nr:hypothetical protein NECAME_04516 [Necator americanus]ETN72336.1 hypothetical protein NECAME_04516 [Necator americanus]